MSGASDAGFQLETTKNDRDAASSADGGGGSSSLRNTVQHHPISAYFVLTFTVSWALAFLVVSPELLQGKPLTYFDGIFMFPAMLIGPSLAGVMLTRMVDGKTGLKELFARMRAWRVGRYALALLIFPLVLLAVLFVLSATVSEVFAPNVFVYGIGFGVVAGYLEEIGWTGYAIRKLMVRYSALGSALLLGALWGLWHAPVVDFLGATYPHGAYWLPFYLSFIALVMGARVLIVWLYANTKSVLLAQATHMSFTGSLALLAPGSVLPAQEAGWYAAYALTLWVGVGFVLKRYGRQLSRQPGQEPSS